MVDTGGDIITGSTLELHSNSAGNVYNRIFQEELKSTSEMHFGIEKGASPFVIDVITENLPYINNLRGGLPIRVVDGGCYVGRQAYGIANSNLLNYEEIIGFDPATDAIHYAESYANQNGYNKLRFYKGDIRNFLSNGIYNGSSRPILIEPNSVELMVAVSVVNHNTHRDMQIAYNQVAEALVPGGLFIFTLASIEHPQFKDNLNAKRFRNEPTTIIPNTGIDGDLIHHFSTVQEVVNDMAYAGFTVIDCKQPLDINAVNGMSSGHIAIAAIKSLY